MERQPHDSTVPRCTAPPLLTGCVRRSCGEDRRAHAAIAEAVLERIDVLWAKDYTFTLTAHAKARGWDAAFGPGVLRLSVESLALPGCASPPRAERQGQGHGTDLDVSLLCRDAPSVQETDPELRGGGSTVVRRRGDIVLREARPWSRTVLDLLRHLEREGFSGAPRVVEPGFDDRGREMLSFVDGESPQPFAWSDDAAADVGAILRDLHRAAATFTPPVDAVWMPWWGRDLPAAQMTIGHCDAAPWNFLARDGRPVALIDWDTAGPVGAIWDLAQTAWLNAQLHDDELAKRLELPTIDVRARLLRSLVDGYGLAHRARSSLVEHMIEIAVRSAAQESIDAGVTATGALPATMGRLGGGPPTSGHDLLWAISWRTRSAAWMMKHRRLLERALLSS